MRGSYALQMRVQKAGGLTTSLSVGIKDRIQFGLSIGSTYSTLNVTHEHFIGEGDETDEMQINHRWVVTGLIADRNYTWWLGAKCEQASRATLYWGGDATGEYAPLIMKATALPIGIYTE